MSSLSIVFFNDTATTEIYTLSLHDALPISAYVGEDLAHQRDQCRWFGGMVGNHVADLVARYGEDGDVPHALTNYIRARRSEEHTSELQSRQYLVCRLLLEKKKIAHIPHSSL